MKKLFTLLFAASLALTMQAQTGDITNTLGATGGDFIIESTTGGILIPKMTEAERDAITTPATGLMIYQTDATAGFYHYDGSAWAAVGGSTKYSIGDFAHGGIVFWVDETGEHGLVCAKVDQDGGSGIIWNTGGSYYYTWAIGDGPYAGKANTSIIIAVQSAVDNSPNDYSARVCNALQITEGGKTYGDWYFPSKQELELMYINKSTINATAIANGGTAFENEVYSSSTESSDDHVWVRNFSNNDSQAYGKNYPGRLRAVRSF